MHRRLCLFVLLAATLAASAVAEPLPRDSVYQLEAPLTDQSGRRLTLAAKRGQVQVVVMFYTACSYICPTIIDTVLDLDRRLTAAERSRLGVLLISLDPRRDDPTALHAAATKRGLDLARWTLVQPQAADVRAIAGVLGVRFRVLADGELNHTGVLVLLDTEGRIISRSDKTSGAVDLVFLARVRSVLAPAAGSRP